ncbi:hypothetical protein JCM17961_23210 [Endothiovibrio diazotrophicus]
MRLLRYLLRKEKPLLYLYTPPARAALRPHVGTCRQDPVVRESGIGRLWSREDLLEVVADYVALVSRLHDGDRLNATPVPPGSGNAPCARTTGWCRSNLASAPIVPATA